MSNDSWSTPGGRLRYVRKEILRVTQDELANDLGLKRSGVSNIEKGRQGIARATVERLYETHGINPIWLISGDGSPTGESGKTENPAESDTNNVKSQRDSATLKMSKGAVARLLSPHAFMDRGYEGRFGYGCLVGTKVRLQAARDTAIRNSNLFQIAEDDDTWFVAGEPDGWEYEMMREYFEAGGDHSVPEWMEFLRMIRWIREDLAQTDESGLNESEARTA